MALINKLTAIADAIRGKTGKTDKLSLDEMVTEISNIKTAASEDTMESFVTFIESRTMTAEVQEKLSNALTRIGENAFRVYKGFTQPINMPNVTVIDAYAFQNCTSITTASFPALTTIKDYAFVQSSLTSIDIPEVTSIGAYAFYLVSKLQYLNLPKVTSIGKCAFQNASKLTTVVLGADTMCTLGDYVDSYKNITVYVPADLVDTYKANSVWSNFGDRIKSINGFDPTSITIVDETEPIEETDEI